MNYCATQLLVILFIVTSTTIRCSVGSQVDYHVKNDDFEVRFWGHTGSLVMKVTCYNNTWTNFPKIKIDQAIAGKIEIDNCSFPETLSFYDSFHSLNFTNYKTIRLIRARTAPTSQNFRKLKITRLEFIKSHTSKLPFDMLHNVSGLKELLIQITDVDHIPKEFFQIWTKNIQKIDFNKNKLQKIAKDNFARLFSLKTLDLSSNRIVEIEPGAFDGLVNLKVLNLNDNLLRTLQAGIFNQLSQLKKVYLNNNLFDDLPQDLLTGIQNSTLDGFFMSDITDGHLRKLPNGFFKNLTFLRTIALENNQLESLPADLFAGTLGLSTLLLGNNKLKDLPLGIFSDTKKLLDLDISNNRLEMLTAKIFENLISLEHLDISRNHLTYLNSEMLTGLHLLKELNASRNNLTQIDGRLFSSLASAIYIDLSFNHLAFDMKNTDILNVLEAPVFTKKIDKASRNVTDIVNGNKASYDDMKNIDLRHNKFTELTAEHIEKLKYGGLIDLRNNRISKINLSGLPFQMSYNNSFSPTVRTMKVLLSSSPLNCNCHFVDAVHYLKLESYSSDVRKLVKFIINKEFSGSLMCASQSEIKDFYGVHNIRSNVKCLTKNNEHKDACSDICVCQEFRAKNILSVDCSHKNLTKIPDFIRNPANLQIELNMSHNMLLQTPFLNESYLTNIRSLDLSYNNISTVVLGVFSSSLKELKLHNNRISNLDSEVIEYLENSDTVRSITLHNNRWSCNCAAGQLLSFVQKKLKDYKLRRVACYETNRKLYKMKIGKLCASDNTTIKSSSLPSIVVLGIVVFGLIVLILYYGYEKQIRIHSKQWCCSKGAKNEQRDRGQKYDAFVDFSRDKDLPVS